ncbi:MAG: DPP IV N-terminal domain-containing protein [Bacteroidales bacterium]|nr:DPP IV N-terminal domain-containing protein [Bacteroidales bacterium]
MKRRFLAMLAFLFLVTGLYSQNTPITEADYRMAEQFSPTKLKRMVFSTFVNPNWLQSGDKFWYSYATSEGTSFYLVDLSNKSKKPLFDNDKMAAMLTLITKDPYDGQHLPKIDPKFKKGDTVFQFDVTSTQDEEIEIKETEADSTSKKPAKKASPKTKKKVFHLEYNLASGKLYELENWVEEKKDPRWASISPDGETVVFARNYNLYWMDKENYLKAKEEKSVDDKEYVQDTTIVEHQLTFDGEQYYGYGGGFTASDNDDEKKIEKENKKRKSAWILWSQDSKKFAMIRYDSRKVKSLWVINVLANPRPELETYKYTMPGEAESAQEELWVFNMADTSRKKIDVKAYNDQSISIEREIKSNKENSLDYVPRTWLSKTSDKIYISRQSRDLYKLDILEVNTNTGQVNALIEERMNTYIEQKPLRMIGDGNEFIHWSERDGWAHLYRYDATGKLLNQITSGPWHVSAIEKIDEKNKVIYFSANALEENENPYYTHLYKVNFDGSGLKLLNKGNFDNRALMSDSFKYFINNYSRVNTIPKTDIRDNNGNLVFELETADLSNLFAAGYKFPEIFKAKAADGITDIYGVMYKPFKFDSTLKYPILEYVYPGPQTEAVNTMFNARMDRTDRFAQLGFVIISLGNRGGNPNRSKWYHNYGYGDLRDYGLADKKYVVEQLAQKHKFIDIDKVGISGHSGGGFMSTAALCQYPDFYKVAVSSAGNHDNSIYNRWWSETHHGVQEKIDEEGNSKFIYEIETNPQLAKNLKGKLLLVHGDIDNNVHPGNTIRMANALIKAKKRFDVFIMPGQRHGFGDYTEYFFWLKADYFCKHLIGDGSISTDIFEMRRETKMTPSKKRATD